MALACPTVGIVQRGFERMFQDLFEGLRGEIEITLFKGAGPAGPTERVPPFVRRDGAWVRRLPVHAAFGRTAMHTECLSFGLAILADLHRGGYDVVHVLDPPLARLLMAARRRLGLGPRVLYTEGCALPAAQLPPFDHVHHVSPVTYRDALAHGIAESVMSLAPLGIFPARFHVDEDAAALRRRYGVPADAFVVLSIAALNREHKRTHHLIQEMEGVQGNVLLWLDGADDHPDHRALVALAQERLGPRVRISKTPTARVGELHRLADLFVHAALYEAFGLAVVEAAASGLPLLLHDAAHFRWLAPNPACWVDMDRPGDLGRRLAALRDDRGGLAGLRCERQARERFTWSSLLPDYVDLYRRVAQAPRRGGLVQRQGAAA